MPYSLDIYPYPGILIWRHARKETGSMASGFGTSDSPVTLFTVTGSVFFSVFGVCNTSLTGTNATVEVGAVGDVNAFCAQITATTLDANMIWQNTTLATIPQARLDNNDKGFIVTGGANIILTIVTADITAGDISFHAFWYPLSADGNVVTA